MGVFDFMRKRHDLAAGIDIGVSSVKIVIVEGGKRCRVRHVAIMSHTEPVASIMEVVDSVSFARLMEAVWRHLPEKVEKVSFVMPGRLVMMKVIDLPAGTVNVAGFIEDELRKEIPFTLDELLYDVFVYSKMGERKAIVLLTKKDILERCKRVLLNMGAKQVVVDTAFTSLANVFVYNYPEEAEDNMVLLLDIGEANTNVVVVDSGELVLGQCVSEVNGRWLIGKVAEMEGISPEEAIYLMKNGSIGAAVLEQATKEFCSALYSEFMVLGSRLGGLSPDKIYITGGIAVSPFLVKWIKEYTTVAYVEVLNPLRRFDVAKGIDKVFIAEHAGEFTLALGGTLSLCGEVA